MKRRRRRKNPGRAAWARQIRGIRAIERKHRWLAGISGPFGYPDQLTAMRARKHARDLLGMARADSAARKNPSRIIRKRFGWAKTASGRWIKAR